MSHSHETLDSRPEGDAARESAPVSGDEAPGPVWSRQAVLDRLTHFEPMPLPPVPWGLGRAMGVLGVALVVTVVLGLILGAVVLPVDRHFDKHHPLAWMLLVLELQEFAFLVGIPWLILWRFRLGLSALGLRPTRWALLLIPGLGAVAVLFSDSILTLLFNAFVPGYLQGNIQETFGGMRHPSLIDDVLLFAVVVVEAPLVEETLFRGVLYQGARRFFSRRLSPGWAVFAGAVVSGILFGLVHLEPHTLPYLAAAGIVYAYVFEYTGSVYASALAHGIGNAFAFLAWTLST